MSQRSFGTSVTASTPSRSSAHSPSGSATPPGKRQPIPTTAMGSWAASSAAASLGLELLDGDERPLQRAELGVGIGAHGLDISGQLLQQQRLDLVVGHVHHGAVVDGRRHRLGRRRFGDWRIAVEKPVGHHEPLHVRGDGADVRVARRRAWPPASGGARAHRAARCAAPAPSTSRTRRRAGAGRAGAARGRRCAARRRRPDARTRRAARAPSPRASTSPGLSVELRPCVGGAAVAALCAIGSACSDRADHWPGAWASSTCWPRTIVGASSAGRATASAKPASLSASVHRDALSNGWSPAPVVLEQLPSLDQSGRDVEPARGRVDS